jgi:outer membrane protein assembly factor BamB
MKPAKFIWTLAAACLLIFTACTKSYVISSTTPVPPVINVPADTIVKGAVYHVTDGVLMKVDMESGKTLWQNAQVYNSGRELYYDAGYLYQRGGTQLTCYNAIDGKIVWKFYWVTFSDAQYSNTISFNDSLLFFSTQTSAYEPANLYWLNKKTGAVKWKKKIDFGTWAYYSFYAVQAVDSNKVVTFEREYYGHRKLVCYNIITGQQIWETPANDLLKATIKIHNNKVYCTGAYGLCYDLATGAPEWQTDLGLISPSSYWGIVSFENADKLYLAGAASAAATQHTVKTVDFKTGLVTNSFTTPASPYINQNRYQYSSELLYVTSYINDTAELNVYDINTFANKWKYRPYASVDVPLVAPKYIMFRESTDYTDTDPNPFYMTVLNIDGKRIRRIKVPGKYVGAILYVDENNKVFRQVSY